MNSFALARVMAAPQSSASPTPGPSNAAPKNRVGDALYSWCIEHHDEGHVFTQVDLLDSQIVPNRDLTILLEAVRYLGQKSLFKQHEVKNSNAIAWAVVSRTRAANYDGLTRDERMVFAAIDNAGNKGMWTKQIKARMTAHAKVLEKVLKSLEVKGRVVQIKDVNHPQRKVYMVKGLTPSVESTGGAWYTEGNLDKVLLMTVSDAIELFVAEKSWNKVESASLTNNSKRKTPHDGFDIKGKSKSVSIYEDQLRSISPEMKHKSKTRGALSVKYNPHHAGYQGYPTLADISNHLITSKLTAALPTTAVAQLLQTMIYDDRLFPMRRSIRGGETSDDEEGDTITMYRCFKTFPDVQKRCQALMRVSDKSASEARQALPRWMELEDIGRGGASEVPCLTCPAFDLCGDGGPVNVVTCPYFDEWYVQAAKADEEGGEPWAGGVDLIKRGEAKKVKRQRTLADAEIKVEPPKVLEIT